MEKTLVLIKPDGIQKALVGTILSCFEKRGLKIIGIKMLLMDKKTAKQHYAHLIEKPFYPDLEKYMTNHPLIAIVLEGKDCVEVVRTMVGATNSRKALPGTIRGDFSMSTSRNIVHASDSVETAKKEIARFFKAQELYNYKSVFFEYNYAQDEI